MKRIKTQPREVFDIIPPGKLLSCNGVSVMQRLLVDVYEEKISRPYIPGAEKFDEYALKLLFIPISNN